MLSNPATQRSLHRRSHRPDAASVSAIADHLWADPALKEIDAAGRAPTSGALPTRRRSMSRPVSQFGNMISPRRAKPPEGRLQTRKVLSPDGYQGATPRPTPATNFGDHFLPASHLHIIEGRCSSLAGERARCQGKSRHTGHSRRGFFIRNGEMRSGKGACAMDSQLPHNDSGPPAAIGAGRARRLPRR